MDRESFTRMMEGNSAIFADIAPTKPAPHWEPPLPFERVEVPRFPIDALPGPMADFVEALADSTQTPAEMGGVLALGVLATAFQSKYEVQVTPDWREPLCLYTVAVAPPGERKSAVIAALTRPIYQYEAQRRELEAVELAQNQTERALLEKALEAAKNGAARAKGDYEARRAEALELSAQLAEFKDRHPFRLLVDDTTPEKLADLMAQQGGSIALASAEGGVFDAMKGRYERGTNLDVYLKAHAGDPLLIDRIGRPANYIEHPRLTMLLTIQPEVLAGLMTNASFRGRGLCGRFLYAMCQSKIGHREVSPPPIPEAIKERYEQFVRRSLSTGEGGTIHLDPVADEIRQSYQAYIEKKLGNEWETMRDWGGKCVGAMVRIAGLMHAAEVQGDPTETPISPETMAAATSIAECLGIHAVAAYQRMGADEGYENARYLWRRIMNTGEDLFTKRDLFNLCKGRFRKVQQMEPALELLAEMGYIRTEEQTTGSRGRPSTKILVNPLAQK